MQIAAYNIRSGGFESYSSTNEMPQRFELLKQAIRQIDADVIGLIDTFQWEDRFTPADIQHLFGYPYSDHVLLSDDCLLERYGRDTSLTVLSRIPFTSKQIHIYNRNALQLSLQMNGNPLDIWVVYFDYAAETNRIHQLNALLPLIQTDTHTIIIGDLNTFSGYNMLLQISAGFKLIDYYVPLSRYMPYVVQKLFHSRIPEILEQQGFRSANTRHQGTVPTPFLSKKLFPVFMELDYIWSRGDIQVSDFEVMRGGVFDYASDHFPVIAKVEVR